MRRLVRLLLLLGLASVLLAGTATGVTVLGSDLVHHASSSTDDLLPPLSASVLNGSAVYADDGTTVIGHFSGPELRQPIPLSEVSKTLITAVLDTEDERYYLHGGFDIPSTIRAFASDSSGNALQGGSTITQQLVKQIYLSPARKVSRKIKEAVLAARLNEKYTKAQILNAYLNIIYLGNSAYGVEAAANVYFDEQAAALTLPQAALLAGLIQDPVGYDPTTEPDAARTRRSEVLARMAHYGDITAAQEAAADAAPLPHPTPASTETISVTNPIYDDYVSEVYNQLVVDSSSPLGSTVAARKEALDEGGLKIVTGLDPADQATDSADTAAGIPPEAASTAGCAELEIGCGYQQGSVLIDPASGAVRAIVSGSGEQDTLTPTPGFDVMTDGTRQAGSGFKLFTLTAALADGWSPYSEVDSNAPCAIAFPGNDGLLTTPAQNDEGDGDHTGVVNVLTATSQSLNCAFLRMGFEVGLPGVAAMAAKMGITTSLLSEGGLVPSMVIGAIPVEPVEVADAYATIADGGVYHAPSFITGVYDPSGEQIYNGLDPGHRVVSTQIAEEVTLCLQAVITSGTGTKAALYDRPAAGKTGTTSGPTDAWFNGFTPQLETTVWMGSPLTAKDLIIGGEGVYGGTYPALTWHAVMSSVLAADPVVQFTPPDPALVPPAKPVNSTALEEADYSGDIVGSCTHSIARTQTCHVPAGAKPSGEPGFGGYSYGTNGYGTGSYGTNGYAYGSNGYGSNGYGSTGYGSTGYGNDSYGSNGYGSNGYGSNGASGAPGGATTGGTG